jgi:hypothetical protein
VIVEHLASKMRRRALPERKVDDQTVIASPGDGAALVLAPTAAAVWAHLAEWQDEVELVTFLAGRHPDVALHELRAVVELIVGALDEAGMLERSA